MPLCKQITLRTVHALTLGLTLCGVGCRGEKSDSQRRIDTSPPEPVVVHEEGFDQHPVSWSSWFPDDSKGKSAFVSDNGRDKNGSVSLSGGRRGVWLKFVPITKGGVYRFSAWLKTDDDSNNEIGVSVRPVGGERSYLAASSEFTVDNIGRMEPGEWIKKDVVWVVPQSRTIDGQQIGGQELMFNSRQVRKSAWMDDVTVERVAFPEPAYLGFQNGIKGWERYIRKGLELDGTVAWHPDGYAEAGSVVLAHKSGVPGLAAVRVLQRSELPDDSQTVTWSGFARCEDGGEAMLQIEQLDASGAVLSEEKSVTVKKKRWSPIKVTFAVRPETQTLRLQLVNTGKAMVTFDSLLLRPAYGGETPATPEHPIQVGLYPADPIAAIDAAPPFLAFPAGQTSAFTVFLAGEHRKGAETVLEIEAPAWFEILSAEFGVWAQKSSAFSKQVIPGSGRLLYRFVNPYNWQDGNREHAFNNQSGLVVAADANTSAGSEDVLVFRTSLGGKPGQTRTLPLRVRESLTPVKAPADFEVGLWAFLWPNLIDGNAREKLLSTYRNAGFTLSHYRPSQSYAAPTYEKLGLSPLVVIWDPSCPSSYRSFPEATRPENMMVLANGSKSTDHLALGLALGDPALMKSFREYVRAELSGLPKSAKYYYYDVEFWGDGSTNLSCFHPSTIERFRSWAKLPADEKLDSASILSEHRAKWNEFRLWVYGEMHRIGRDVVREFRPELKMVAYAYVLGPGGRQPDYVNTAPMSALTIDPIVDGHLTCTYNMEGSAYIDNLNNTIPYLKKPVWPIPFVMKEMGVLDSKSYNYAQISAREFRFQVLAAAALGGKGISGYPGQLLDADYLHALRDGLAAAAKFEDFYFKGTRDDASVKLVGASDAIRHTVHTFDGRRLLTIFNAGTGPVEVAWDAAGQPGKSAVEAHGFLQIELTQATR